MDENPARRWLTLAAGTIALTAGCAFQYGLAAAALVPVTALEVTAQPGDAGPRVTAQPG